jgi:hypothetical protein
LFNNTVLVGCYHNLCFTPFGLNPGQIASCVFLCLKSHTGRLLALQIGVLRNPNEMASQ